MELEYCPRPGPVIARFDRQQMQIRLFRPPCKQWSCAYCGPQNALEWGYVAWSGTQKLQDAGLTVVFMTLTSHEKLSPERTFDVWPDAWKKLRQRIVREYGKPEYFMVPERHRSGRLHMHALMSADIDGRWLKTASRECGLGYMADVRIVEQAIGAAFYAAKYLNKHGVRWPNGWRRVRLSRDWPKEEIKVEDDAEYKVLMHRDPSQDWLASWTYGVGYSGWEVVVAESLARTIKP